MKNVFGIIFANYTAGDFGELLTRRTIASLPFASRYRLVDFPLSNMVNSGIQTVGLIMPSVYRSLIDHVGSGKEWGLDRKTGGLFILPGTVFSSKGNRQKFTLSDLLVNQRYIVRRKHSTDALITCASKIYNIDFTDLIEQHRAEDRTVTFAYYKAPDGELKSLDCFIVKHNVLIDIIDSYSTYSHLDLVELLQKEIPQEEIGTYIFGGKVESIDCLADYVRASFDLLDSDRHKELFRGERRVFTKVQDEPPTRYGDHASAKNSLVPAGCKIDGKVENSILFRNVTVEEGAVLKNCIIFQHCVIRSGAVLENVILDKYVDAGKGVKLQGGVDKPLIIGKNQEL